MNILRRTSFVALAIAIVAIAQSSRADDFTVDDGTSDTVPASLGKVVLVNQTAQPRLKVYISAKPNEKPQPQTELRESDYTVNLFDPKTELSIYVSTKDDKKKSAIRRAKAGDVLAVVYEDGHLAILKRRTSAK